MATSTASLSGLPVINMPWIGPPANESGKEHQDIHGPLLMATHCKNPVIFWCLPEHLTHYQKAFEIHKERYKTESGKQLNVTVRSIGELLEKKTDDQVAKQAIEQFKAIQKECLRPERNQVRDRVTVKNAFTLLVLLLDGGYVADTNVRPANNKEFSLPQYDKFRCPIVPIKGDRSIENRPEIWLMYSPHEKQEFIKKVFYQYYKKWTRAEEDLRFVAKDIKRFGYPQDYHDAMGLIVVDTIRECAEEQQFKQSDFWRGNWELGTNHLGTVTLQDINIFKRYDRTHVKKDNPFKLFSQANNLEAKQDAARLLLQKFRYDIEYITGSSIATSLKELLDNCMKHGNSDLSRTNELGDIVSSMKNRGPTWIDAQGEPLINNFLDSILQESALFKFFIPNRAALDSMKKNCFEYREDELDALSSNIIKTTLFDVPMIIYISVSIDLTLFL